MIDCGMILSAVLGLVGGGALTGFMLRKQTEGSATAGVVKESMEALKSALETLTSQQDVFGVTVKSKDDEHSFAVDLYKSPIVELTEQNKAIIKEYTEKYFKAFVQVAVNELLD